MTRVLLVGAAAREHTIAWKLRQSPKVDEIFVAPGNGGTASIATNIPVSPTDIPGLVRAAKEHRIDFYLASTDDPQPLGLVDRLKEEGILCYGPSAAASKLEASKAWAKEFMGRHSIATAAHRTFRDHGEAVAYVGTLPNEEIWVKASGLAAGKGAIGCPTLADARKALNLIMVDRAFGAAGDEVVVEQSLRGWETSAHAFCDGRTAVLMPFSSDHKRALDGDLGANTGGMGAYSPSERVTPELEAAIRKNVVDQVMSGMATEENPFNGTLFPGLMVTDEGPVVLEFNARMGDPETQVLLPRLESDLFEICYSAAEGRLHEVDVRWSPNPTVGVVIASGGYPGAYDVGYPISGIDAVDPDVLVFQAGTKVEDGRLVTNGGRVLTVVAAGDTLAEARDRAYDNVRRISFEGSRFRTDIGARAVANG